MNSVLEQLANDLAAARTGGGSIEISPDYAAPGALSVIHAYRVQERISALLGGQACGWKVGSTSVEAQRRLGTSEPGAGRLLRQFVFDSGAEVVVSGAHDVQAEVEFAFRMGVALAPQDKPYQAAEVREAVAAFIPGIELVGSRFVTGLAGSGRALTTADSGANVAFIGGQEVTLTGPWSLADHGCSLFIDGRRVAVGTGARALGDPLVVLTWVVNHLSARGITLAGGDIVTTGTCTGLEPVANSSVIRGDFGSLGAVEVSIKLADE